MLDHICIKDLLMISRSYKTWMLFAGDSDLMYIYKLRAFRRKTLLWINVLNKASTLLSRSSITSNSHDLGTSIYFVKRYNEVSNMEMAISLVSGNILMNLQFSCSAGMDVLLNFLNCFCDFFANQMQI